MSHDQNNNAETACTTVAPAMRSKPRLSDLMGDKRIQFPLVTFDAVSGRLLYRPVPTQANQYSPDAVDISGAAIQVDPNALDRGYRAFASGGVAEHITRDPVPCPAKPSKMLQNRKGDAPWSFFVRIAIAIDGRGRAVFEIDERNGGRRCMEALEDILEGRTSKFVILMSHAADTDNGMVPVWTISDDK